MQTLEAKYCKVYDWGNSEELFPFDPQKHMLYLNIDNSLHDCCDIRSGDLHDSDIVQDYKKMSRKLSQNNMKVRPCLCSYLLVLICFFFYQNELRLCLSYVLLYSLVSLCIHTTENISHLTNLSLANHCLHLLRLDVQARRKSSTPQPVKPRLLLYSRSISDLDEGEQDHDWKLISFKQVSGKSLFSDGAQQ